MDFTTGHEITHNKMLNYLPASLFLAQLQACRDTEYKTCHFEPSSSSFYRDPQSSPTSTCQDGNQWGDPTNLALVVTRIQFETTLLSHILMHSADAEYKDITISINSDVFKPTSDTSKVIFTTLQKTLPLKITVALYNEP